MWVMSSDLELERLGPITKTRSIFAVFIVIRRNRRDDVFVRLAFHHSSSGTKGVWFENRDAGKSRDNCL